MMGNVGYGNKSCGGASQARPASCHLQATTPRLFLLATLALSLTAAAAVATTPAANERVAAQLPPLAGEPMQKVAPLISSTIPSGPTS
jgi:hypothetical protein